MSFGKHECIRTTMATRNSVLLLTLLSFGKFFLSVKACQMATFQTSIGASNWNPIYHSLALFEGFIGGLVTGVVQGFDLVSMAVLGVYMFVHFTLVLLTFPATVGPSRSCSS